MTGCGGGRRPSSTLLAEMTLAPPARWVPRLCHLLVAGQLLFSVRRAPVTVKDVMCRSRWCECVEHGERDTHTHTHTCMHAPPVVTCDEMTELGRRPDCPQRSLLLEQPTEETPKSTTEQAGSRRGRGAHKPHPPRARWCARHGASMAMSRGHRPRVCRSRTWMPRTRAAARRR